MGIMADTAKDIAASGVKALPPITVTGLTLSGVTLQEWVLIATLIYTVLQILILIRDKLLGVGPKEPLHERVRQRLRKHSRN